MRKLQVSLLLLFMTILLITKPQLCNGGSIPVTFAIDTSDECDIYLMDRMVLKDVKVVDINDSILTVTKKHFNKVINIDNIFKIIFKPHAGFITGLLIVEGASFAFFNIGALINNTSANYYGAVELIAFFVGLPVGIVSGFAIASLQPDEIHNLYHLSRDAKYKRIKFLIKKHS